MLPSIGDRYSDLKQHSLPKFELTASLAHSKGFFYTDIPIQGIHSPNDNHPKIQEGSNTAKMESKNSDQMISVIFKMAGFANSLKLKAKRLAEIR